MDQDNLNVFDTFNKLIHEYEKIMSECNNLKYDLMIYKLKHLDQERLLIGRSSLLSFYKDKIGDLDEDFQSNVKKDLESFYKYYYREMRNIVINSDYDTESH